MRNDGTLDDQCGLGGSADRSDDTPSTDRSTSLTEPSAPRLSALGFLRTRLGGFANPLAPRPGRTRLAVATGAVCCLGLVGFTQVGADAVGGTKAPAQPAELAQRATPDVASRGIDRQPPAPVAQTADPDVSPSATKKPVAKPKPKPKPKRIAPVAGLDEDQMDNAKAIVRAGRDMGVPRRGLVIAVATAMQESNLYNYASGVLPESQNYPHQAIGWDHDSVGLFQQRPSSGWGSVGDLMDPKFATHQFLAALEQIPGWQDMALTDAAQAVQVSAFPWAYAQHEWRAEQVVDAILG
ncbi:peptidase M23 [Micromonospora sp. NBC_00898]|uniref:peptidase M23 n=1 Tax=Micromonospora sp. NBC_00898 TaxID=2975981 RepID=UPI00386D1AA2|nr:peptidase M23 [Micromonospora sp. NBC_00898]